MSETLGQRDVEIEFREKCIVISCCNLGVLSSSEANGKTMLLAEIHGKYQPAAQDHEDYLTSTVFSHLRYVPPGEFWSRLFSRAMTVPIEDKEHSLTEVVGDQHAIARYETLTVHFWPKCPGLGEPELAMCFEGGGQQPLVILVEVKLHSGKSGSGDHDQLKRYLLIADEIGRLQPEVPKDSEVVVVYLTPRDSLNEVEDSLMAYGDSEAIRRLFRLQWQEIIKVIDNNTLEASSESRVILENVRDFLRARRLEYFDKFTSTAGIERLKQDCGSFYKRRGVFGGFAPVGNRTNLTVVKGEWCNG